VGECVVEEVNFARFVGVCNNICLYTLRNQEEPFNGELRHASHCLFIEVLKQSTYS